MKTVKQKQSSEILKKKGSIIMKNWNEILEDNLQWNGQSGDETVRGVYFLESEEEKNDFVQFDLDEKWWWEFDDDFSMTISFTRAAE